MVNAEIHFLTKTRFLGLVEHNPQISKIYTFEKSLSGVIQQLDAEKYDLVVDLHHNLRTFWIKLRLGRPALSFDKLNLRKWLYVNLKWKSVMPDIHITERYLQTVQPIGVADDGKGLEYFPCDCESVSNTDLPDFLHQQPFIALSIGGTHQTKKMPVQLWIRLVSFLPIPAIIVGGKEDFEAGRLIENGALAAGKRVWNACGQFTIGGSAHLLKKSSVVITHDTGMMHIAAAFQKPVVAIWGNTTPQLGMYPFRVPYHNLEVKDLECRPCSKIGFERCPKGHFRCMHLQNVEDPDFLRFINLHLSLSSAL